MIGAMIGAAELPLSPPTVTLRPYRAGFSDTELMTLYRWACDSELLSLTSGVPLDMTFKRFRSLFLTQLPKYNSKREQLFAILDRRERLIGRVGLFGIDPIGGTTELGILIGDPNDWGKGFGRAAAASAVDFAFDELGLRAVILHTYPDNIRAQRAFAAIGFRITREIRRFSLDRGTHDEIEMRITPADRPTRKHRFDQDSAPAPQPSLNTR
jgi:RimJ/RimL family protein N-acetyltransferase